jgi:hypothetical protein
MRKRLLTVGLMLALSIAGAAWALQPTGDPVGRERIVAADDSERGAPTDTIDRTDVVSVAQLASGHRRMLGMCGLAMVGAALVVRARRPLTI